MQTIYVRTYMYIAMYIRTYIHMVKYNTYVSMKRIHRYAGTTYKKTTHMYIQYISTEPNHSKYVLEYLKN